MKLRLQFASAMGAKNFAICWLKEIEKVRIHEILEGTTVNGPGFRLCVWVQGCERRCEGCFNKETWEKSGGKEISVEEIIAIFKKQKYDGISISGGEPFLQDNELEKLLKSVKSLGKNTFVFTGFKYEELIEQKAKSLDFCDYIVDGAYEKNNPRSCKYAGSGNQRYLHLENGKIKEDLTNKTEKTTDLEIHISENGQVVVTGFGEI